MNKLLIILSFCLTTRLASAQVPASAKQPKVAGCAADTSNVLPKTWLWIGRNGHKVTLTPQLIQGLQGHWMIVCFQGDSATGFQKRYLGADVALTDSIRTHGNKNEHMRMHPFMRFLFASEWKDSCQAKEAFWRMVNEHSNHHE